MRYSPLADNPLRTREDLQRAMIDLFEPLLPHFSPGAARVRLGSDGAHYTASSVELEAFSRPLWGLIPLALGGGAFAHWELYQRGLANGTDPGHPEFWQHDANQRFVEMAAIALGLCLIPGILWDPLPGKAKENLAAWLGTINATEFPICNWLFFRILVNVALRSIGAAHDAAILEADLVAVDRQYLGGGWYSDGINAGANRDYYVPFALHFYGLIYSRIAGEADPERAARFRERGALFAGDFIHWFAPDGSSVPFGRSQTYRFAQASFWPALLFANVETHPPGVIKGLLLRHLRWWFQRPIFTETGLLTIGYGYPNMFMAENYNAPGSPYWALKAFLPLAFAESDPFWSAAELPLPDLAPLSEQKHAGMILCRQENNAVALRAGQVPPGHRHSAEKYCKFAYSTGFAFNVPTEPRNLDCRGHDNMLALSEEGTYWRVRGITEDCRVARGVISCKWSPWPDVRVRTWLIPHGAWHLRVHRIETARRLETAEGGFAIRYSDAAKGNGRAEWISGAGAAFIPEAGSASGIRDLCGARAGENVPADPNSNLLLPNTAIPTLRSELAPGVHWLAAAVLGHIGADGAEHWEPAKSWGCSEEALATNFGRADLDEDSVTLAKRLAGTKESQELTE